MSLDPHIVVVSGRPGAGRSPTAHRLARPAQTVDAILHRFDETIVTTVG